MIMFLFVERTILVDVACLMKSESLNFLCNHTIYIYGDENNNFCKYYV